MIRFSVLNWNIGGAKVLEQKTRKERENTRNIINNALKTLLSKNEADVITLQEIVQWSEPKDKKKIKDLLDLNNVPGYSYFPFPLIDSDILSSKAKWNKVKKDSDWHPDTFFAQGNAFLIKNNAPHFPVWDLSNLDQQRPTNKDHFIELVHLDSGLYFGDRNTEPRAALVAHFIYNPDPQSAEQKPLDIFVINLHLTTLMMEREGVPEIDMLAAKVRQAQLDVVFNGIISRYNSWRQSGYRDRGERREEDASYKLTQKCIENAKSERIPSNVLQKLNPIKNKQYRGKAAFLDVLKDKIEVQNFNKYNSLILNQAEKKLRETFKRHSPIWIIAGDFNFTEESAEYAFIKRMNFIDTVIPSGKKSQWGNGTKASGTTKNPTLTLDYIFAGPKFVSLDPAIAEVGLRENKVIHDHDVRASDHCPVLSSLNLIPL